MVDRGRTCAGGTDRAPKAHIAAAKLATASPPQPAVSASEPAEATPVDMERLLDFTGGDIDEVRELVEIYLTQTPGQKEQLQAAVGSGAAQRGRPPAPRCGPGSAPRRL